jgi:hypothetical protein
VAAETLKQKTTQAGEDVLELRSWLACRSSCHPQILVDNSSGFDRIVTSALVAILLESSSCLKKRNWIAGKRSKVLPSA